MVHYGYVPAATDPAAATNARSLLNSAGCHEIIEEPEGGRRARLALANLIERLRPGDRMTIGTIAHVAHSVAEFCRLAQQVTIAGAQLRSLAENFDSGTDLGYATIRMLAPFSNFEIEQIATSTKQGLASARARGEQLGRPRRLSRSAEAEIHVKLQHGDLIKELARHYRVSPTTIRRIRAEMLRSEGLLRSSSSR